MKRYRDLQFAICNIQFAIYLSVALLGLLWYLDAGNSVLAQSREGRSADSELLKNLKTQSKNDIEREVFGADGKEIKDKLQKPAGQGGGDINEQLQRELGAAAEKEDDNPLSNIARTMLQVRRRMAQTDAGQGTQNLQKQIIADLDLLIEQARKSCGQCPPGASNQQPSSQNPKSSPNSKPGAKAGQKPGSKPAAASSPRPPGGREPKPDVEEMRAMIKNLWGELPPHVREQMMQNPIEEFVPKYQQLIEDYFRELSEEKKSGE